MILLTTTSVVTEEPTNNMNYGDYVSQNGRSLEGYVEAYLELYHEVCWDDETLKHHFWSGMDNLLRCHPVLPSPHLQFSHLMMSPLSSMSAMSPWAVVLVASLRVSTVSRFTAIGRRPGSVRVLGLRLGSSLHQFCCGIPLC